MMIRWPSPSGQCKNTVASGRRSSRDMDEAFSVECVER